ncbi:MAG: CCA tRNA nucleotidyltransferase [Lachnospiraceae bacterium]|nr:CCA tRNA nucleotidyltransferase [Lachnospiraceae bacterium]
MQNTTIIQLPEKVKFIIDTIMEAGYEAYAVGGCIRDSILLRKPSDWDITTSASPYQVKELFRRTLDTGIKHGTVTVMLDKEGFEVTTYRIDGEYEDGRHPKEVTFTRNLTEDLKRRDFTINAMAYNEKDGLVDIFGGLEDIRCKMIRCVGDPVERFSEDALRMMRAVRFSAQLGYRIEEETSNAIRVLAPDLKKISAERIQTELVKLLTSPHPDYLRMAYETGITKVVLPEFDLCMITEQKNPHHCYTVGEHTLVAMQAVRADKVLRLAMLFHDMGKPLCVTTDEEGIDHFHGHPSVSEEIAGNVLHRLKFDNDTIYMVKKLVKYHDQYIEPQPKNVRRAIRKMGEDVFPLLLEVKEADVQAQSDFLREKKEKNLKDVRDVYQRILEEKQCVSLKTLAINGKDLIDQTGMKPGKELGEVLNDLLDLVTEDPARNTREYLLKAAKERLKR